MKLKENHEIVGVLIETIEIDDYCKLKFTCSKEVDIPKTFLSKEKLSLFIGKKIGIFNYNGNFFFREIKKGVE